MNTRKLAKMIANNIQELLVIAYDGPMDGDNVDDFTDMLKEEINKLMGNV